MLFFFGSENIKAFGSTTISCESVSTTTCSVSCSESDKTPNIVCSQTDPECAGSCSESNDKKSLVSEIIKNIYIVTKGRVELLEINKFLKGVPMPFKGKRFNLNLGVHNKVQVIIGTDFPNFSKVEWEKAIDEVGDKYQNSKNLYELLIPKN